MAASGESTTCTQYIMAVSRAITSSENASLDGVLQLSCISSDYECEFRPVASIQLYQFEPEYEGTSGQEEEEEEEEVAPGQQTNG
jgi:hypothetical protein